MKFTVLTLCYNYLCINTRTPLPSTGHSWLVHPTQTRMHILSNICSNGNQEACAVPIQANWSFVYISVTSMQGCWDESCYWLAGCGRIPLPAFDVIVKWLWYSNSFAAGGHIVHVALHLASWRRMGSLCHYCCCLLLYLEILLAAAATAMPVLPATPSSGDHDVYCRCELQ